MNSLKKQLTYFNIFKDIISIFGEIEIGNNEVDVDALATYLSSDKFFFDNFTANTEEEMQKQITDLIENGFPVWRFLKCSEWTKNMVEQSFKNECEQEKEELFKTFKCFTCQYYSCNQTSIGLLQKCTYEDKNMRYAMKRREEFSLKKKCKNYLKRVEEKERESAKENLKTNKIPSSVTVYDKPDEILQVETKNFFENIEIKFN